MRYVVHQEVIGEVVRDLPMELFLPRIIEDMTVLANVNGYSTPLLQWSVDYTPPMKWKGRQIGDRYRVNATVQP